jgi:fructokinase
MPDDVVYGGVEAGGTKFVCVLGTGPDDIRARARIDTTSPGETLAASVAFFREQASVHGVPEAIGVASFGPVELRRDHPAYGLITTTPKPGWTNTDVVGPFSDAFGVPVGFDTDVNGAALGEWTWGAGRGLASIIYLTVGTGIGGGAIVSGQIAHGLVHPEMGHVSVTRQPGDGYPGHCPFHGDCLEGMAAGPAIEERWGRRGEALGELTEGAVELEAAYLASGLRQFVYTLAPERIVIGGGVSEMPGLLERVRSRLLEEMAGYAVQPEHEGADFVVPPGLGSGSGAAGALALAMGATG